MARRSLHRLAAPTARGPAPGRRRPSRRGDRAAPAEAAAIALLSISLGALGVGCTSAQQASVRPASASVVAAPPANEPASGGRLSRAGALAGELAVYVMDAQPAPDAGFLPEPERLWESARASHPFQRVWVERGLDLSRYGSIHLPPVDTAHMIEHSLWDRMSTASFFGLHDDPPRLAGLLHAAVEEAFREDPSGRFDVVAAPGPGTLVLELALVEAVPNKSLLAIGALAAFAAPPVIGSPIGTVASRAEHGALAIEGRVRCGVTGEVLAMFADRETAKTRILDLQAVRWYGHAGEIFEEWALQLVAVANRPEDPGLADPVPFTLTPW